MKITGGFDVEIENTLDSGQFLLDFTSDTPTADQKFFSISKGTTTPTEIFSVDEDGDIKTAGRIDVGANTVLQDGSIDLGAGPDDDLTAEDITDLTDGGDSTRHSHLSGRTGMIQFFLPGEMSTTGGPNNDGQYISGFRFPLDATVKSVFMNANTSPAGSALTLQVSDGTNSATATLNAGTAAATTDITDMAFLTSEDLTLEITGVGSTTAGSNLNVVLYYEYE
jgi:hypothetical protein